MMAKKKKMMMIGRIEHVHNNKKLDVLEKW